jgi:hypothetical protein
MASLSSDGHHFKCVQQVIDIADAKGPAVPVESAQLKISRVARADYLALEAPPARRLIIAVHEKRPLKPRVAPPCIRQATEYRAPGVATREHLRGATHPSILPQARGSPLLARLGYFLACRPFEIHSEPQDRDEYTSNASRDILGDLSTFFPGKFLHFDVVGFDLSRNHRTGRISVCDLNGCDWLWVSARTSGAKTNNRQNSKPSQNTLFLRTPLPHTRLECWIDAFLRC